MVTRLLRSSWSPVSRCLVSLFLAMSSCPPLMQAATPQVLSGSGYSAAVSAENRSAGTFSWQITTTAPQHEIEGYASAASVEHGGTIGLFVSTIAPSYHLDVYRMGWYQGTGAHHVAKVNPLPGMRQRTCHTVAPRNMVACAWRRSYTLKVPSLWRSGVYLVKLTANPFFLASGYPAPDWQSYISFIVRDDASTSALLFQTSVLTYQAYNVWGGDSLYGPVEAEGKENFARRSYAVSFDRPYERGWGAGDFFFWEYPMLRWLEMNGYDISYSTDLDTDASPQLLLRHKAFLSVGHDEYWTQAMRDNVENALHHGVSLGFFGANMAYWQVRLESSATGLRRVVVCYKDKALDPLYGHKNSLVTVKWRDPLLGRPEDALIGQMWESWFAGAGFSFRPIHTSAWPFAGTGLHDGSILPGIVGYEYDRQFRDASAPTNVTTLAASPVINTTGSHSVANTTLYTAMSGARVFAAGTIQWSWGLDDDVLHVGLNAWAIHHVSNVAIGRMTANILNNLAGATDPPLPGVQARVQSHAPSSTWFRTPPIVSMAQSVPSPRGIVSECSTDGGSTWRVYQGAVTLSENGRYFVECRARAGTTVGTAMATAISTDAGSPGVEVFSPQKAAVFAANASIPLVWRYRESASGIVWGSILATVDDQRITDGQTIYAASLGPGRHILQIRVASYAGALTLVSVPFIVS